MYADGRPLAVETLPTLAADCLRLISFTVSNSSHQTIDSQAMGCIHVARRFGGRIPTLQARLVLFRRGMQMYA